MSVKKFFLLVLPTLLFFSCFSQEKRAAVISGLVKDAHTKLPLNEAVVTLSSPVLSGQKFALTDSTGMYKIANLPPGTYSISFEMEGYEKFLQENISLKEGMSLGVSFEMVKERRRKEKQPKSADNVINAKKEQD
jgi:hypothetical protein